MTANVWYNEQTKKFIIHYQGKRYERTDKEAALMLMSTFMSEMRLEPLYA